MILVKKKNHVEDRANMLPLENLKFYFEQETMQLKLVLWTKKERKKKDMPVICNNIFQRILIFSWPLYFYKEHATFPL